MTLEEAIKTLDGLTKGWPFVRQFDQLQALKLGIDALKFRERWEQQEGEDDFPLLPGETEE